MIDEEATFKAFGYYSSALQSQSNKPILAACDNCGKSRVSKRQDYRSLCGSCSKKGNTYALEHVCTEEAKANMRGRLFSEETKALMSVQKKGKYLGKNNPNYGKRGVDSSNYKGGKKLSCARRHAKRRGLGCITLNTSFEGDQAHHITHNYVVYIPTYIHKSVWHNLNTGQSMEAINTLALDFLVNGV